MSRTLASTAGALVCALVVAACGSQELTYVGGQDSGGMYFTVPAQWHGFDTKSLSAAEAAWGDNEGGKALLDATTWQAAFDGSATPSVDHVFSNEAADQPTAFASVRTLYDGEKSAVGPDPTASLRDLVLPVTTLSATPRDDFTLVSDDRVEKDGFIGRHLVMRYRATPTGVEQTIDQTAYFDPTSSSVYLMVVRCSTECFQSHQATIEQTVSSLTLKESRRG